MHNYNYFSRLIYLVAFLLTACSSDSGVDEPPVVNQFTLTVTASLDEGGTVTPTSAKYSEGKVVSLSAAASAGYFFKEWTGSVQGTSNPISVTMDANKTITGVFEQLELDADGDGVRDDLDQCPNTQIGLPVNELGCANPIYLDDNGVTIKCYDWAEVGDMGEVNGVTYTIVNKDMLLNMIAFDEDMTSVCTTKVTDMKDLFSQKFQFNQDISSWDVSNVTTMRTMFYANQKFNQPL